VARDGVRVPYTVIRRKGTRVGRPHATLVSAYGAYQYSTTPRFSPTLLPFLDAGGVYVNANVRGGGEYGREWHQAGKKASKPNTWRDLIDICEMLVRERLTTPRQLAITGTSAGGIAVGRAMTERPDLFAAVISDVGWSNPIRYMAEQNIADIGEWGPAVDAASFRLMLAMDSVQAVRNGVRYPALLCVTGATDPRVAPWHQWQARAVARGFRRWPRHRLHALAARCARGRHLRLRFVAHRGAIAQPVTRSNPAPKV
jgi:prolyl oligopeptidase